ncbi:WHG domain-containing protein [Nocardioides sp. InS609-2]|uniref:TetR/AcrR family transcriptional regulator n=1 Tax=Nocardioides sp. InS609-2 TaxID=2760705 RepID=UPI0020BDF33E|nr:WHG domain-containing protein [Nocardioides sp. InS609-2]
MTAAPSTRRDRQRQATLDEIVLVARDLLAESQDVSLRSVAQRMGLTAPALYRYVSSYDELLRLVAIGLDTLMTEEVLVPARDSQPDDDPAAQITCATIAFREWALSRKQEFGLVFANLDVVSICSDPALNSTLQTAAPSGILFTELLGRIWEKYQFPLPDLDSLEPALVEVLRNPAMPAKIDDIPDELRGLVWVFTRSWAALYGTVTLEVFGHLDPRIIESGVLFRQMFEDQAALLGLGDDLPRLRDLIAERMSA